jgi:tetratricopeptide (TPR) repeat protein
MCRPAKVCQAIELFAKAYHEYPDMVALNQIALAYEMLGEFEAARTHFTKMHTQAASEGNATYLKAAELGLTRISQQ